MKSELFRYIEDAKRVRIFEVPFLKWAIDGFILKARKPIAWLITEKLGVTLDSDFAHPISKARLSRGLRIKTHLSKGNYPNETLKLIFFLELLDGVYYFDVETVDTELGSYTEVLIPIVSLRRL